MNFNFQLDLLVAQIGPKSSLDKAISLLKLVHLLCCDQKYFSTMLVSVNKPVLNVQQNTQIRKVKVMF